MCGPQAQKVKSACSGRRNEEPVKMRGQQAAPQLRRPASTIEDGCTNSGGAHTHHCFRVPTVVHLKKWLFAQVGL